MTRLRPLPLAALLAAVFASSVSAATYPTPEIAKIETIDVPGSLAFAMRARLGNTNTFVGLSLLCPRSTSNPIEVTAYFGGFPSDARPVQLAVRDPSGAVAHFGPAVRGTRASGFHSPRVTDPLQALEFVNAALQPGALVSNGYRSFWNRASRSDNRRVHDAFVRCLRNRGR